MPPRLRYRRLYSGAADTMPMPTPLRRHTIFTDTPRAVAARCRVTLSPCLRHITYIVTLLILPLCYIRLRHAADDADFRY